MHGDTGSNFTYKLLFGLMSQILLENIGKSKNINKIFDKTHKMCLRNALNHKTRTFLKENC